MRSNYREGLNQGERDTGWRKRAVYGPWFSEPDWAAWDDDYSGCACAVQRNRSGAWCGYVFLPDGHPVDQPRKHNPADDDDLSFGGDLTHGDPVWLDCHGGVTWHGPMNIPEANLSGTAVGFDCCHSSDAAPTHDWSGGTYSDLEYVVDETTKLAAQISEYGRLQQLINAGSK